MISGKGYTIEITESLRYYSRDSDSLGSKRYHANFTFDGKEVNCVDLMLALEKYFVSEVSLTFLNENAIEYNCFLNEKYIAMDTPETEKAHDRMGHLRDMVTTASIYIKYPYATANTVISSTLIFFYNLENFRVIGFTNLFWPMRKIDDSHGGRLLKNLYLEAATDNAQYNTDPLPYIYDFQSKVRHLPDLKLLTIKNISARNISSIASFVMRIPPGVSLQLENFTGSGNDIYGLGDFPRAIQDAIKKALIANSRPPVQPPNSTASIQPPPHSLTSPQPPVPGPSGTRNSPSPPSVISSDSRTSVSESPHTISSTEVRKATQPEFTDSVPLSVTIKPPATPSLKRLFGEKKVAPFRGGRRKKTRRHRKDRRSAKAYTRGRRRLPSR